MAVSHQPNNAWFLVDGEKVYVDVDGLYKYRYDMEESFFNEKHVIKL